MKNAVSSITKSGWLVLPILTVMAFIAVEVRRVAPTITISNLDYFPLLERATRLSFHSLDAWVNQQHPVGYSWLIRLGLMSGWDAERVGQALSIAGGVLGLMGAWLIAMSVFKDKRFAAIALAFVATTSLFLYLASVEGNDMLAAGMQVMSLGLLAISTLRQDGLRSREVFLAGLAAGLAYLVRYNGMLTMMAGAAWLALMAILERRPSALKALGIYVGACVLSSALQWIPSWLATGTPFYNDQGRNVWFHVYGKTDFIREFGQTPAGITLIQVVLMNPYLFIEHWWSAFQRFWIAPELTLLDAPLKLFGQAGFVFLLLAKGPASGKVRGLLGLFVMAHLSALSMMRLDRRFLIVMIPILTIGAVYFFASLIPSRLECRRVILPLNIVILLAGLVWAAPGLTGFSDGRPGPDTVVIEASNVLHAAGMDSAREVLSTHLRLQDAASLGRDRFPQAYWVAPDQKSAADLAKVMHAQGWKFLIYSQDSGPASYPALASLLMPEARMAELAPIYFPENREFVIYRLVDQGLEGCTRLDARLESGISLECYAAHVSQNVPAGSGRRIGVYLSWRTQSKLDASFKVFVHLLDSTGRLVAQHDGVPTVWTYPTNQWEPGQAVVDFHQIPIDANVPPGEYTLQAGLYDEETGARVQRVDAVGNSMADAVALGKVNLGNP